VKAKSFRKKMQVSSLALNRQKEDLRIREE